jgi:hypothetical protein
LCQLSHQQIDAAETAINAGRLCGTARGNFMLTVLLGDIRQQCPVSLSALEFLKLKRPLEIKIFSNHDFNLHWSDFQAYEPSAPARAKKSYDPIEMTEVPPIPDGFTVWDRLVIDSGDMTLQEFFDFFPGCHHGVVPCYIAANSNPLPGQPGLLFTSFGPPSLMSLVERFKCMKMSQVYLEQYGPLPACGYLSLQISATLNDELVAIPNPVLFKFADPFPTP